MKIDGGRRDDPQQLKKGSHSFRQRLLLWTLSSTPIIRQRLNPSLQHHEMSLLRLFETVSDDCVTLAYRKDVVRLCNWGFSALWDLSGRRGFRRSYPQSLL
ncbi:BnaA03g51490D [Brassica napus]|uniref:Uncharacterized protein n=2 Tax=Brassica TaxID=3705 RepID=M4D6R8_BRACM|nr:unnamed protein product [Brassica napus]CDY13431.1 BnaA03g51490D [Brassica napus]